MSIFSHDNYRSFLRAHMESLPKKGWGFASRAAEAIDVHQTFFSLVLAGEKQLTPEQGLKLAKYVGLNAVETDYFIELVHQSRAGTEELRAFHQERIDRLKQEGAKLKNHIREPKPMSVEETAVFYSNHLYSAVRMHTSLGKGQTFEEIQRHFQVPPQFLKAILEFLVEHDLCFRKGDRYFLGAQKTWVPADSPQYFKHATNWRLQALQKLELNRAADLFFTSPMSMSYEDSKIIREQLVAFVKEVSERVRPSEPEETICMNIDFFRF